MTVLMIGFPGSPSGMAGRQRACRPDNAPRACRRGEPTLRRFGLLAITTVLSLVGAAAAAQEPPPAGSNLSVVQQLLDPPEPTLRLGSALLEASAELEGAFDSNIRATPHARSDFAAALRPQLSFEAFSPHNAFALKAQGEFRRYLTQPSENVNNVAVAAIDRVDLSSNAYLLGAGGFQLLHEDRGALVAVNGRTPTEYTVASGSASFVIEPSPLGLRLDGRADSYAYNNITTLAGAAFQETGRDRIIYALEPRVSYQIVPQYNAFLHAVVNRRQYNHTREADGLDRDSTGYSVDLGIATHMAGFAEGEIYIGYLRQIYDARAARPIAAVDFGTNLEWRPMADTSLRFNLSRSIEESALPGARGYLQTAVGLSVEHELFRNFVLLGTARYINAGFSDLGTANIFDVSLGARYFFAPSLSAGLEYDFRRRISFAALPGYTRQIVALRLRGEL
jgi:hypothetical protein